LEESREEKIAQVRLVGRSPAYRPRRQGGFPVEDQDKRTEEQEDVEAHHKHKYLASEDAPKSEDEDKDEDFELHRRSHKAL
jgi:hypothetical protein